ncbi:hypothetical protein [Streptosporangium amethystogenes]|uniref:hypothetical protein n=1 Tax=Streptosporangium amethystogenes TaxID=2002 RepID=UPI0004C8FF91|nr:hypothetical protein [Streptosporangium amethystogenes]
MNTDDSQQEETVGQAFADYLNLVDEVVAKISDADIEARISRAMGHGAQNSTPVSEPHTGPAQRDFSDTSGPGAFGESGVRGELVGPWTDTVLAAGTALPRRAGVLLARSRTADRVVGDSGSRIVPSGDLRMMSDGGRQEVRAVIAEWREQLSACPAGAFGAEGTAMVLGMVATLAETLIADRDERAALDLVRAASPHLRSLGHRHPAAFEVRRVRAEALSELGWRRQAEAMLRELSEDEQRVFGSTAPRTALLLLWALVGQGRLREAEDGFRSLEDRLTRSPGADTRMLLHVQCRSTWLRGRLGRVDESVSDYALIISNRIDELGEDHTDTLDARHSQGKILVVAGQGAQALPLLRDLADDRARVQGDRHPDTLETLKYHSLAKVLVAPGDDRVVDRVIRDLVEIDRIQRKRHGRRHPMRQDTAAPLRTLLRDEPISGLWHVPIADEEQRRTVPWSRSSGTSRNTRSTPEQIAR